MSIVHFGRITALGMFARSDSFSIVSPRRSQVQKSDGKKPKIYRKGQCHSSVFSRAMSSALHSCTTALGGAECCVILTGGSPDAVVGAIATGYKHVIYVASDDQEQIMMNLPAACESQSINFDACPLVMLNVKARNLSSHLACSMQGLVAERCCAGTSAPT
jgi:hypothetical protein